MKKTYLSRAKKLSLVIVASAMLSTAGCQLYNPVEETQLYPIKPVLKQTKNHETFSFEQMPDEKKLKELADNYKKSSDKPMVIEAYYHKHKKGQAEKAIDLAAKYKRILKHNGVNDISINMIPHDKKSKISAMIKIHYTLWTASAPIGCDKDRIPGFHAAEAPDKINEYKMGCETETYISKMVARPKDLAGNSALADGSSKREGNMMENNQNGVPNTAFEDSIQITTLGDGQ